VHPAAGTIATLLKEINHCARKAGIEQLKFSWIHQVKKFHGFTKKLFLWVMK